MMVLSTDHPIPYTGPAFDARTGAIELGPSDGRAAPAAWQLYAPDVMLSGFISHRAGMGASRLLDLLGHSALASGCTEVWHADPQGVVHSPALVDGVDVAARSMRETRAMIEAVCRLFETRAAAQRRRGARGFTPSPTEPGLLVLVEEFEHLAADGRIRAMLEEIAANDVYRFEHVGIGFAVVIGLARPFAFNNSRRLRAVLGHNQTFLHQGGGKPFWMPDLLGRIPKVPGYGCHLVAHPAVRRSPITTVFRARYLGDTAATRQWFAKLPARRPTLPGI